jgi:ABC-type lipoprotein release transport system permease subunit
VPDWATPMLYGIAVTDPCVFTATGALLALSALAAVYMPARRAARIDPDLALQKD